MSMRILTWRGGGRRQRGRRQRGRRQREETERGVGWRDKVGRDNKPYTLPLSLIEQVLHNELHIPVKNITIIMFCLVTVATIDISLDNL